MRNNKVVLGIVLILMAAFVYTISSSAASSEFAAKVNGVGIKEVSLDAAVENFVENQKSFGVRITEEDKENLRKDILEELISAELLYQQSKKAKLGDLKKKVNEQFDNIKNGFGSEQEFRDVLKERGITEKDLREDVNKGIHIKEFLDNEVYGNIVITEDEKRQEYEENKEGLNVPDHVRASHILISVAEDASGEDKEAARGEIEQLRKRAVSGEDFAELAKENSDDSGSAPQGGDIGYFKKGDMVGPFETAAFNLNAGEISDVVETQFGYHIIKLVDKRPAHMLIYEEVEKDIERFLLNRRRNEELNKFVEKIRKDARIERY